MGAGLVSTWFVLPWYRWIGYLLLAACLITVAEAWNLGIRDVRGGGVLGAWLYATGHRVFSPAGSGLVWLFALLAGMELSFKISWLALTGRGVSATARKVKTMPKPKLPPVRLPRPKPALPSADGLKGKAKAADKTAPVLDIEIDRPGRADAASIPATGQSGE